MACEFCKNGWFDPKGPGPYFGQDVECVNGVLIDIDDYMEGYDPSVVRPIAPCHPDWDKQCADPDDFVADDYAERLAGTASIKEGK